MKGASMNSQVEALLSSYERGRCTRRQFVAAVSALLPVPSLGQTQPTSPIVARDLNHVTLHVKDLGRSLEFYQRLLGLHVTEQGKDYCNFGMRSTFLFLDASKNESAIDHFCIGIDGFNLQATKQKLAGMSVNATIESGDQLYVRDPDGLRVQFSPTDYRG